MKCDNCNLKCPQEELACEIAKGRMYATNEVVKLQKQLEEHEKEVRNKTIDECIAIVKANYRMKALEQLEQLKAGVKNED